MSRDNPGQWHHDADQKHAVWIFCLAAVLAFLLMLPWAMDEDERSATTDTRDPHTSWIDQPPSR